MRLCHHMYLSLLILCAGLVPQSPVRAQDLSTESTVEALEARIEALEEEKETDRELLDELRSRLDDLESRRQEEKEQALSGEIDAFLEGGAEEEEPPPPEEVVFTSPVRQLRELNPEISVLGDFLGKYSFTSSDDHHENGGDVEGDEHEHEEIDNGYQLKEVELSLQAPLDPYSLAKFFVGFHGDHVHVEEAYAEWLNLPASMQLKLGKFRDQFGVINRWHPHAYPTFQTPLALESLFGEEGLTGIGASATFLLPPLWADYNELVVEVINGDNETAFSGEGFEKPVGLFHLKNYYDISNATYFEAGLSGAVGENEPGTGRKTSIGGLDLALVWIPPQRSKYRSLEWRTELYFEHRETLEGDRDSFHAFSFADVKFSRRWTGGLQFDYTQDTLERDLSTTALTPFLTFWQSEFVRLRFHYQTLKATGLDRDHRVVFQATFALGPHKHEKY
jgi:hypothetical protein